MSERAVLSAMVCDPRAARVAAEALTPEDFGEPHLRRAFAAFVVQFRATGSVDSVVAQAELSRDRQYAASYVGDWCGRLVEAPAQPACIEQYVRLVREGSTARRLGSLLAEASSRSTSGAPPDETLAWLCEQSRAARGQDGGSSRSLAEIWESPPEPVPHLIDGLAHERSKITLAAPSKARKTWIQLHLGLCVATGLPWLGHETRPAPVLYVNLELSPRGVYERARALCQRLGCAPPENFRILQLRGAHLSSSGLRDRLLCESQHGVALLIVDPLYKLLAGRDENAAGDVGEVLADVEAAAAQAQCAVLLAHHFAKGNAGSKNTLDRASGSGVFARDGDSILTLTPHKDDPDTTYTLEFVLRDLPPQPPQVLRWQYPLFAADDSLRPCDHAQPGRSARWTTADVVAVVAAGAADGSGLTHGELCDRLEARCGVSPSTAARAVAEAKKRGEILCAGGVYAPAERGIRAQDS